MIRLSLCLIIIACTFAPISGCTVSDSDEESNGAALEAISNVQRYNETVENESDRVPYNEFGGQSLSQPVESYR
ncbi:MAG: hypothetical protein AAGD07_15305 [Planctomycetota bacterium]